MKTILFLTFDYELPLGSLNASYQETLFNPTYKILEIAEKNNVKVTLFADVLGIDFFKDWDYENFYKPCVTQLRMALEKGHDVQLHLHPHWLTSKFENGKYQPSTDFSLSEFSNKPLFGGIDGVIKKGINIINEICKPVNKNYSCVAFRGGGYNIYPFTEQIFSTLQNHGIKYDSSMARGYYYKSNLSEVDYKNLPNKPNWYINPSNLSASGTRGIIEIPILTIPKKVFEIPTRFKLKKYSDRAPINTGTMIHANGKLSLVSKFRTLLSSRMLSFDNYTYDVDYLMNILDYNLNKYSGYTSRMFSTIGHPKSMREYSLSLLDSFIKNVKQTYPEFKFLTFSKIEIIEID